MYGMPNDTSVTSVFCSLLARRHCQGDPYTRKQTEQDDSDQRQAKFLLLYHHASLFLKRAASFFIQDQVGSIDSIPRLICGDKGWMFSASLQLFSRALRVRMRKLFY